MHHKFKDHDAWVKKIRASQLKRWKKIKGSGKMVKTLCEVYSRVVGYIRPVANWNDSKQAEFHDRKVFQTPKKDVVDSVRDSQTHL